MKTQVKRIIDGIEKTITVNAKYAGTSQKPVDRPSEARRFIVKHEKLTSKRMLKRWRKAA